LHIYVCLSLLELKRGEPSLPIRLNYFGA